MQEILSTPKLNFDLPFQTPDADGYVVMEFYPKEQRRIVRIKGDDYLIIGNDNANDLAVKIATGEVFAVVEKNLTVDVLVNSSVTNLVTFLDKYRRIMETKTGDDVKLKSLLDLWFEIKATDPKAMAEGAWWNEFLYDKLLMFGGDEIDIDYLEGMPVAA